MIYFPGVAEIARAPFLPYSASNQLLNVAARHGSVPISNSGKIFDNIDFHRHARALNDFLVIM